MRRTDTAALGLLVLMAAFMGLASVDAPAWSERPPKRDVDDNRTAQKIPKAARETTAAFRPVVLPAPPAAPVRLPAAAARPVIPETTAQPTTKKINPLEPAKTIASRPPARKAPALKSMPRDIPKAKPQRVLLLPAQKAAPQPVPTARSKTDAGPSASSGEERAVDVSANGDLASGRVMLRLLEHDAGPEIRLIWPDDAAAREALYRRMSACFGMISAVMTGNGKLYRENDEAGRHWAIDTDRYSGFIRAAEGAAPKGEQHIVRKIRAHHRLAGSAIVRVFPRWVDAGLLTGLQAVAGPGMRKAKRIDARYVGGKGGLEIAGVTIDGKPATGRVRLRARGNCG